VNGDDPSDRELRLLGDLRGKRVLDLGCGTGAAAIGFAHHGAIVIALDASDARLAHARERAEREEVKVEWRKGDLADLAFLRAESIDAAFSADAVAEVDDAPRLFRQVQRVLKPNGPFVFSYEHPMALCIGPSDAVERSYFEPGPIDVERDGETARVYTRGIGEVFTELGRAGFRVDTVLEPRPDTPGARVPASIVWRARKEGA
jgi:ubiquinone/menaquinone biosynthesis C-methylase UbiE